MSRAAIFLDRDGVLTRNDVRGGRPFPPGEVTDRLLLPDAASACRALKRQGFPLIVVTNQPDVARGLQTVAGVEAINEAVRRETDVDAFYVCFHDDRDHCDCRKPKPGLLLRAARDRDIDLHRSVMVGDRWRDIEAGRRAGCHTVLVNGGHGEPLTIAPDIAVQSLSDIIPLMRSRP